MDDPTLLAWWRFEEEPESRVVLDCSGHGLDGVLAEGTVRRVPGRVGRAIDLDGEAGCFDLGTAASLSFTTTSFTVSAWVLVRRFNVAGGTSPRWVVGRAEFQGDGYQGWGVGSHGPSNFELKLFAAGEPFVSVEGPLPERAFVHVAAVYDVGRARARVFTDGALTAEVRDPTPPTSLPQAHAWLGCRNTVEDPFDGVIDEVRVYGRALDDAEIAELAR